MTVVSNDPKWWSTIDSNIFFSYWTVAAGVVVVYDWVLTLGQEIELIWRKSWSPATVLYLVTRYIGIPYSITYVLRSMPFVSLNDAGCKITYDAVNGINLIVTAMLGVIMIARLHAIYQGSRIMLIFLIIIFLAVNIACGVIAAIGIHDIIWGKLYLLTRTWLIRPPEEWMLSGTYMCNDGYEGDVTLLNSMFWMLNTLWEIFALCLSVWIAVKDFYYLRRLSPSTGSSTEDCSRVLINSHVLYFASFVYVCCLNLVTVIISPVAMSTGAQVLIGACQILWRVQMFVLGPRLILGVREYHAKVMADFDADTSMNSIIFQESVHVSTTSIG